MDSTFLNKMKEQLLARRVQLVQQLTENAVTPELERQGKDVGDEALSATLSDVQSSLDQTEINELNRIDAALASFDRGEYGICIDCNDPISQRRLEYSPYVDRCIVCQEAYEREQEQQITEE